METTIFARLSEKIDSGVARVAWLDARNEVLEVALRGAPGKHRRLDALINMRTAALRLVTTDSEIGKVLCGRPGQCHAIVRLADSVNEAREAYWRFARAGDAHASRGKRGSRTRTKSTAADSS